MASNDRELESRSESPSVVRYHRPMMKELHSSAVFSLEHDPSARAQNPRQID
jgi:hypothetical protein